MSGNLNPVAVISLYPTIKVWMFRGDDTKMLPNGEGEPVATPVIAKRISKAALEQMDPEGFVRWIIMSTRAIEADTMALAVLPQHIWYQLLTNAGKTVGGPQRIRHTEGNIPSLFVIRPKARGGGYVFEPYRPTIERVRTVAEDSALFELYLLAIYMTGGELPIEKLKQILDVVRHPQLTQSELLNLFRRL